MHMSGERARFACWRARPRDRGLFLACSRRFTQIVREVRFGATPKPARETRALPNPPRPRKVVDPGVRR
jgi:hypothetical protein